MLWKEVAGDNDKALLVYAIGATIFTVCISTIGRLFFFFVEKIRNYSQGHTKY